MSPAVRTRTRLLGSASVVLLAAMVVVAALSVPVTSQPRLHAHAQGVALEGAPTPSTTTTTAPAPATATFAAAAVPAESNEEAVPPAGQATAWGCGAALAYLQAYAAKGFALECPGYAEGREAMTCVHQAGACPGASVIAIADPCPQAYMNEASNSFVITGVADTVIDPFGPCP